jgi:large subunit ribosomal protein L35Ae
MIMAEKKKPAAKKAVAKKAEKKAGTDKAAETAPQVSNALILSFRRGRHTQRMNQFLVEIKGADTKAKASLYIGRRVVWTSPGKTQKQIHGKITTTHGNSGVLRARFSRGLPGTAVGTRVELLDKR